MLILPTRDWWAAEAGLSPTFNSTSRWAAATGKSRERLAARIDADAREYRADYIQSKLDRYFDSRHKPADDLLAHNSARHMSWAPCWRMNFCALACRPAPSNGSARSWRWALANRR